MTLRIILIMLLIIPLLEANITPFDYIHNPSSKTPLKNKFVIRHALFEGGGWVGSANYGINNKLTIGASFGGMNIIGYGEKKWNKHPGFLIKYRVTCNLNDETKPDITIGLDTQGKGSYFSSAKRYLYKSPGLFAVVSKDYPWYGFLTISGGLNYSLETNDDDENLNIFLSMGQAFKFKNQHFYAVVDYDFALNDNDGLFGRDKGYINMGIKYSPDLKLIVSLNLIDLQNNGLYRKNGRTIEVEYRFQ